jgi:arginase
MDTPDTEPDPMNSARTLRLVWPQWQGAGRDVVALLLPEVPIEEARRAYTVGNRVLEAILPAHSGPTEIVPVDGGNPDEGSTNGIESRSAIIASLAAALEALGRHDVDRILTLGGDCSVSVAPFAALANKYGRDLAVVWIDSHPDVDTPNTAYDGYHAMAVATLTGHGDQEIVSMLPATIDPARVALAGLHSWFEDAYVNIDAWGLHAFSPGDLRTTSEPLLQWLAATGASKVAIHLDVDSVDSNEAVLVWDGLDGRRTGPARRHGCGRRCRRCRADGVEFIPRNVRLRLASRPAACHRLTQRHRLFRGLDP